jgi:hypothetical protein
MTDEKKHKGWPKGKKRGPMTAHHREKIGKSGVLTRLIKHAEGNLDPDKVKGVDSPMTASQVSAGLGLLNFAIPKLNSTELKAEVDTKETINVIEIVAVPPKGSKE